MCWESCRPSPSLGLPGGIDVDKRQYLATISHLSNVRQLIIVQPLNIVLLHQRIDVLLDISDLRRKSVADLIDDFFDEVDVLEFLATFHDTHDDSLKKLVQMLPQ